MCFSPVVPAKHIAYIRATPAIQPHAPAYGTVHKCGVFPNCIRSNADYATQCIDIFIGRYNFNSVSNFLPGRLCFAEYFFCIYRVDCFTAVCFLKSEKISFVIFYIKPAGN